MVVTNAYSKSLVTFSVPVGYELRFIDNHEKLKVAALA